MSIPQYRPFTAVGAAVLLAGVVSGCSHGTSATATTSGSPSASPSSASPTPSPSPPLSTQQAASRAAYNAYVGSVRDFEAVAESTRDHYDSRLRRHATSTGFSQISYAIDQLVASNWGIHGHSQVVSWKVTRFSPPARPEAVTATACLDSSKSPFYDRKTGKVDPPLPGHERVPVLVQVQRNRGVWKVVYEKPNAEKTC